MRRVSSQKEWNFSLLRKFLVRAQVSLYKRSLWRRCVLVQICVCVCTALLKKACALTHSAAFRKTSVTAIWCDWIWLFSPGLPPYPHSLICLVRLSGLSVTEGCGVTNLAHRCRVGKPRGGKAVGFASARFAPFFVVGELLALVAYWIAKLFKVALIFTEAI